MEKNRVVWIGAIADKEYLDYMTARGNRQSTAYNVQGKYIKGLRVMGIRVDTLNGHVMPPFPRYKDIRIPGRIWKTDRNELNVDTPFLNLPLINLLSKGAGLIRATSQLDVKQKDTIIVYSLHSPFLRAATYLKQKIGCTVIVLVPDLPEFMSAQNNFFRKTLKKVDRIFINKYLQKLDGYVLFAKNMDRELPPKESKITIEGILEFNESDYLESTKKIDGLKKVVMYSGNLNISEGIVRLLDIFSLVRDDDCELWITGMGDGEKIIKSRAKEDKRIKYLGYIDEYAKLLELQKQAKVLVSMVDPKNPKSDVFFPSKLMEYLLTGREVMCYKLGCIPPEYDNYLKYFIYESAKQSAKLLEEGLDMSLEEVRVEALKRIELLKKKDLMFQVGRLIEFINEVRSNE